MGQLSKQVLLTIDENMFYRLLEGPGRVRIDIVAIEPYFLPFVSFHACVDAPDVHYGLILRNGTDLLAAESVRDLVGLLREMAGWCESLEINAPEPAPRVWEWMWSKA